MARHECLSGHELALPGAAAERRGAQLLAELLVAHGVAPQAACAVVGAGRADQAVDVIVAQALDHHRLDALVHLCDQAFDLDLEPRSQMSP
jgi:hypothetical protein